MPLSVGDMSEADKLTLWQPLQRAAIAYRRICLLPIPLGAPYLFGRIQFSIYKKERTNKKSPSFGFPLSAHSPFFFHLLMFWTGFQSGSFPRNHHLISAISILVLPSAHATSIHMPSTCQYSLQTEPSKSRVLGDLLGL